MYEDDIPGDMQLCFNPRAREGRDCDVFRNINHVTGFNPRAREGRDH